MKGQKMNLRGFNGDRSWTLFLDRDGIINEKIEGNYVRTWDQFKFKPHFLDCIKDITDRFGKTLIVTNQRCIAKTIITEAELHAIHRNMLYEINQRGSVIDNIYYCPHEVEDGCNCRKPKAGMALSAKEDFKEIDFKKAIMVGDSDSDMEFGKQLGMVTVLISAKAKELGMEHADYKFSDIRSFYESLTS